jgi:hypothetical protein
MENLTIKTRQTQEIESDILLPKFFQLNKYHYYKLINNSAMIVVTFYTDKMDSITSLELWPSIKLEHTRYLSWMLKPDNLEEITEEEFEKNLKDCKKLISSL